MREHESYEEFLYQYELLRTRLEIRQYFLNTVVKEVYENIGQVLSYVRIQLALVKSDPDAEWNEKIEPSYKLIGKAIGDLRNMCKLFDPEESLIKKNGFFEVIRQEVQSQYPQAVFDADGSMAPVWNYENRLVALGIILELLGWLKAEKRALLVFSIKPTAGGLQFTWQYAGEPVQHPEEKYALSVFESASLLGGALQEEGINDGISKLILTIPIK